MNGLVNLRFNHQSQYYRERNEKIFRLFLLGVKRNVLAERFGLDPETIRNIIKNEKQERGIDE